MSGETLPDLKEGLVKLPQGQTLDICHKDQSIIHPGAGHPVSLQDSGLQVPHGMAGRRTGVAMMSWRLITFLLTSQ
jgi:hypothetical protein